MNVKINRQKFKEKEAICIASKFSINSVVILTHVQKFLDTPPFRKWSLSVVAGVQAGHSGLLLPNRE